MANNKTSDGLGEKGSKLWMQKIVNPCILKSNEEHNKLINKEKWLKELNWKSPLTEANYHEYRLNEHTQINNRLNIKKELFNLSNKEFDKLFSFWPSRGNPVWDAIALSKDGKELYLFEAKAHTGETKTKCKAKEKSENENLIIKSMYKAYKNYSVLKDMSLDDWKKSKQLTHWKDEYYQLANRLTFLYHLNEEILEKSQSEIKHCTLVLLNIVNDEGYKSTNADKWKKHYEDVFEKMIGSKTPPKEVKLIYIDTKELSK